MSVPEQPAYGGVPQWPFSPPDAIAWGWRKFTKFLGPVMIGVAIYVAFTLLATVVGGILSAAFTLALEASPDSLALKTLDVAFQVVVNLGAWVVGVALAGAAARAALDVADGRQYDFLNALRRIPIGKLLGAQLLIVLAAITVVFALAMPFVLMGVLLHASLWVLVPIGAVLLFAFAILMTGYQYLVVLTLVDEPATRVNDALGAAFLLARANLANLILLSVLLLLVVLAGFLACCVGLVVAYPVTYFATAHAYRRFRGQFVAL